MYLINEHGIEVQRIILIQLDIWYTFNWYKLKDLYFDKDSEDIFYDAPFSTWNIKYK